MLGSGILRNQLILKPKVLIFKIELASQKTELAVVGNRRQFTIVNRDSNGDHYSLEGIMNVVKSDNAANVHT